MSGGADWLAIGNNWGGWGQIIIILLIVAATLIRAIVQAFSAKPPRGGGPRESPPPRRRIQDVLGEIREQMERERERQAGAAGRPPRRPPVRPPELPSRRPQPQPAAQPLSTVERHSTLQDTPIVRLSGLEDTSARPVEHLKNAELPSSLQNLYSRPSAVFTGVVSTSAPRVAAQFLGMDARQAFVATIVLGPPRALQRLPTRRVRPSGAPAQSS